jgi:hypothetical protein
MGGGAVALLRRIARARLASQVIRRLRGAGVTDARYDAGTFSVRFTSAGDDVPTIMELGGLVTDRPSGRRERRARLDRFVAGFLRTPAVPADWTTACRLLRPVLRGATPLSADVAAPLRRPAMPYLSEYVVVDRPDTMTYVSADQLDEWGVSAEEAFQAARSNLSGAVLHGVAHEPTVVRFVDDGDAYWTSHLLLDGWLSRLTPQVGGVPVAFAPERGTLIVAPDGSAHLPELLNQVEQAYASSQRAITPMAYVSDEHGRTVPYAAPEGHPMRGCVQRAEAVLAVTEYGRQAATLSRDAAALRVVGSEPEGWRTRALWTRDEPTMLPRADEVLVGETVRSWAEVEPHLTPVPDLDPPRWRAEAWPADNSEDGAR